jgi:hypothetical protein
MPFRIVGRGQSAVLVSADETTLVGDLSDPTVVILKENVLSVGWPKRTGCNGRMPKHRGFGVKGHDKGVWQVGQRDGQERKDQSLQPLFAITALAFD